MRDIILAFRSRPPGLLIADAFILALIAGLMWTVADMPHPLAPKAPAPVHEESV